MNTLIIGDSHIPFTHRNYLDFCKRIHKQFKCQRVVHIGDLVDNNSISYHEIDPNGWSPAQEMEKFTKSLGHKHPCSLPNYSDHIKPFKKDPSLKCSFIPSTVSCRESLLLMATIHKNLDVKKNFEFISVYGHNPYAYILILEMKR